MKYLILLLLISLSGISAFSQDVPVEVIPNTATLNEHQDTVTITYDLASGRKNQFYNIFLKITLDGEEIHAKGLTGDVGNLVKPGKGKKIIWMTTVDVLELTGTLKIEVLTDTKESEGSGNVNREIKIVPAYAGLGGAVVSSGTLAFMGFKANSDYKDIYKPNYDIYSVHKDPNDITYYGNGKPTRQELYDQANSKYKKGQYLLAAGGAVLVAGGFTMISRIIKINKYKKELQSKRSNSVLLKPKPSYLAFKPTLINGISALGLTFTF